MADNIKAIELLFGVAGGGNITGESGKKIKNQLTNIANHIKPSIVVKVNEDQFKKQLKKLRAELQQELGTVNINPTSTNENNSGGGKSGNKGKQDTKTYKELKQDLEAIYRLRKQISGLDSTSKPQESENLSKIASGLEEQYRANLENAKISEEQKQLLMQQEELLHRQLKTQENINKAKREGKADDKLPNLQKSWDGLIAKSERLLQREDYLIQNNKKAAASAEELRKAMAAGFDPNNPQQAAKNVNALRTAIAKCDGELAKISVESDTFGFKIKKAFETKVVQNLAYAILALVGTAFKQVYDNVVKLDDAVTDLQIATGGTREETEKLVKQYAQLAKQLGTTVTQVTEAADTWLRQGYDTAEANELITNTLYLAKLGQLDSTEAAKALTSAMKGYNITVEESIDIVDKFTAVDMVAAVSAGDIATAMAETAVSANTAGVSMDRLIGYIATVAEVTQDGAESVGTFYKTMFARMSNIKAGRFVDDETGESLNDVASVLNEVGVSLFDAEGQFKSFETVLDELGKKWEHLDTVQQAAIATAMAGTRQQEKFKVLMENYSKAMDFSETAMTSSGTAEEKYNEAVLEGVTASLESLKASWEEFSQALLDSDLIKFVLDILQALVNVLTFIIDLGDGIPAKAILITVALTMIMAAFKKLHNVVITKFPSLMGAFDSYLMAMEKGVVNLSKTVVNALKNPYMWAGILIAVMTSIENKAAKFFVSLIILIAAACVAIVSIVKATDKSIKAIMASNIIGWILLAVGALVSAVVALVDWLKEPSFDELKEAAQEAIDAWTEVKEELEEVKTKIQEIEEEIERLNALDSPTLIDDANLAKLKQELAALKQEESAKEQEAIKAERDAMNKAEDALDKYKDEHDIEDGDGYVVKTFDQRMDEILKNYYGSSSADKELALDAIRQYSELLGEFEYGMNSKLDTYFDDYYSLLDKYTTATDGAASTWESIINRIKYKDAIDSLRSFADTFKDTSKITGEQLKQLAEESPEIQELFDYLQEIGMWDGNDWNKLNTLVGSLRTSLTELSAISITDDIEEFTNHFEALSDALEDVAENGILSLGTLQKLMDEYPELLEKYFSKNTDGYKLNDAYSEKSNYTILQDMAVESLTQYQDILQKARETLAGLTEGDDDYETAVRNVAIAQDNLNMKALEWATILRESAIEEETSRLEDLQESLEEQLSVYKDIIDIRKDLLETYKEEEDYQKELANKQKNVADLRTQLSLAQLDKSAAGQARARELQNELNEAQEELDDYTLERAVNEITKSLDDGYEEYERLINEQIETIGTQIEGIATTLKDILTGVSGLTLTNTTYTGEEMYDLYSELQKKQAAGMTLSEDAKTFMDAVQSGNYAAADKLYAGVKTESDNYKIPEVKKEKTEDEKKAEQMSKFKGAWGKGIASNNAGDNGIVNYNGKEYHVQSGGDDPSLYKAAYEINDYGDRDIFYYNGGLYGCLDGSIVKLTTQDKWGSFWNGADDSNNYTALLRAAEAAGVYHTGGFVGDVSELKSNEEFAKLLKGEFVATPHQMDNFIKNVLPSIASSGRGGAVINNNSPLVAINCGAISEDTLPYLDELVDQAVRKIEKNMVSALSRTGYRKQY